MRQRVDQHGDDAVRGPIFGPLGKLAMSVHKTLAVLEAPVAPKRKKNAERLLIVLAGADFVGRGAALDLKIDLGVAGVVQRKAEKRLGVDHLMHAFMAQQAGEGAIGEEGVGDELVMVASVFQIEAENDFQVIVIEVAEGQVIGRHLENDLPKALGFFQTGWVVVTKANSRGIETKPSLGAFFVFVFLQQEGGILASAKLAQERKLSADAVKKVKDRLALQSQVELQKQSRGDMKIVTVRSEFYAHCSGSSLNTYEAAAALRLRAHYARQTPRVQHLRARFREAGENFLA